MVDLAARLINEGDLETPSNRITNELSGARDVIARLDRSGATGSWPLDVSDNGALAAVDHDAGVEMAILDAVTADAVTAKLAIDNPTDVRSARPRSRSPWGPATGRSQPAASERPLPRRHVGVVRGGLAVSPRHRGDADGVVAIGPPTAGRHRRRRQRRVGARPVVAGADLSGQFAMSGGLRRHRHPHRHRVHRHGADLRGHRHPRLRRQPRLPGRPESGTRSVSPERSTTASSRSHCRDDRRRGRRRPSTREIGEVGPVDVAPRPVLAGLDRPDQRVPGPLVVASCVLGA